MTLGRLVFLCITLSTMLSWRANAQFKVIGYYPTWKNYPNGVTSLDLARLTHLNIAFANPNSGGILVPANGTNANVTTVVNACHAKGVKVFMSIGGAGAPGTIYKSLLNTPANINSFVSNIVSYAVTYNLDGIDVDIEGDVLDGSTVTTTQYQNFVTALGAALHAQNMEMSAALASWFSVYISKTSAAQFDWINIMSYDQAVPPNGTPAQHSSYAQAVKDFNFWKTSKGVSPSRLVLGVPFYGYGWGTYANTYNSSISYCSIVSAYPGAENSDQVGSGNNVIYYNGIPTMEQKTAYAMQNGGGITIWEMTMDCNGSSKSLLKAINRIVHPAVITFNDINKTYGDPSFTVAATSNSDASFTYSIISGNSFATITPAGQISITGAGTVLIKADLPEGTVIANGSDTARLTIAKAPLTVRVNDTSRVYHTANPAFPILYSGFVNGENTAALSTLPTVNTTADINSNVRTYSISLSGASAANYTLIYKNGTLAVMQASPDLTFSSDTFGLAGSSIKLTSTSGSAGVITYSLSNGTGTAMLSGNILSLISPGTVTVTASIIPTHNYTGETISQIITIDLVSSVANSQTGFELSVYPNPSADDTKLQLNLAGDGTGSLWLCDVHGRILQVITEGSIQRNAVYTIPMASYPSGLYLLKLGTDKGNYFHKITR